MMSVSEMVIRAIVPAAGIGKRAGGAIPKQYQQLHERTVLDWTLSRLLEVAQIHDITVAISADDPYWQESSFVTHERIRTVNGGSERCYSVLNALKAIGQTVNDSQWVLVHDAARPCVRLNDIENLINSVKTHDQGGILAMRVRDTMKMGDDANNIIRTIERQNLWHALTPQLFRHADLQRAIESALDDGFEVTDEASAIEHAGMSPLLVESSGDNIKITHPEDMTLAEFYLAQQVSR
jgi:2-C-methyl-D-erythritol 4-phosphate cytidylyltransferase